MTNGGAIVSATGMMESMPARKPVTPSSPLSRAAFHRAIQMASVAPAQAATMSQLTTGKEHPSSKRLASILVRPLQSEIDARRGPEHQDPEVAANGRTDFEYVLVRLCSRWP